MEGPCAARSNGVAERLRGACYVGSPFTMADFPAEPTLALGWPLPAPVGVLAPSGPPGPAAGCPGKRSVPRGRSPEGRDANRLKTCCCTAVGGSAPGDAGTAELGFINASSPLRAAASAFPFRGLLKIAESGLGVDTSQRFLL